LRRDRLRRRATASLGQAGVFRSGVGAVADRPGRSFRGLTRCRRSAAVAEVGPRRSRV